MLEYDWDQSIGYLVCWTSHLIRRELGKHLSEVGLTLRQWEVLAYLSARGGGSQAEMAEYLGIEPPTLTGVLNRMEEEELITRECCDTDGRRKRNFPTPRAQELWVRASELCHSIRQQAIAGLTEEEMKAFKVVCERIQQNLGGLTTVPSDDESQVL